MGIAYMHAGQQIEWGNATYTFDRLIGDEWQLFNDKTHKAIHLPVAHINEKYTSGEITFYATKSKYIPDSLRRNDGSRLAAHLDLYPEAEKEQIKQKRLFLESYLKKFGDIRSQSYLKQGVDTLWNSAWGKAPHAATAARWLKRYIESGRDARSLGNGNFMKGNIKSRYPTEITEICHAAIRNVYLKLERGSINATLTEAERLVREENEKRLIENHLAYPTKSYIRSLISSIPEIEKDLRRYGRTVTEHKHRNAIHGTLCSRPLERVEIDHTQLDIVLVDSSTGHPVSRPWLTLVVDVYTRAILGFNLTYAPPSHASVAKSLKMALLPKVDIKQRWPSIKGTWGMYGCMEDLVVDNALEFHGLSLEEACYQLGINISFCPRKKSWWKGHVERVIGTLNRAVTDGKRGRTFSGIKEKSEYDPVAKASIPFEIMEEIIAKWIVDIYHETTHSTLGLKPHEAWDRAISPEDIPMVTNASELDAVMGIVDKRTLTHLGIEINSLRYNSHELGKVREFMGNVRDVTIKWNPEDLGFIHVLPNDGKIIRVPVVTMYTEYASGLTLYQHKANKTYAKKYLEGHDNHEALSIAKAEIFKLAEKGAQDASKRTRVQNKRLQPKKVEEKITKETSTKTDKATIVNTVNTTRPKFQSKISNRTKFN